MRRRDRSIRKSLGQFRWNEIRRAAYGNGSLDAGLDEDGSTKGHGTLGCVRSGILSGRDFVKRKLGRTNDALVRTGLFVELRKERGDTAVESRQCGAAQVDCSYIVVGTEEAHEVAHHVSRELVRTINYDHTLFVDYHVRVVLDAPDLLETCMFAKILNATRCSE